MKTRDLLWGLFATVALAGCSNDEIVPDNNQFISEKGEAYMTVRLAEAGSMSRGIAGDDGDNGPIFSEGAEHAVKDASFYFYDEDGNFVSEGSVTSLTGADDYDDPDDNIEFQSNTVVALKGLTQKNFPKFMVTVLNKTANFNAPETLDAMAEALSDDNGEGIINSEDNKNYFVMSTTSYAPETNGAITVTQGAKYFVDTLTTANFSKEPIAENYADIPNPVVVYVERLAAKVEVSVHNELAAKATTFGAGDEQKKVYEVTATVAGNINVGDTAATSKLYVELNGWTLNGTAKKSNIVKAIDANWVNTASSITALSNLGFDWNDPANFRSYWGKSFNYGTGSYPTKEADLGSVINDNDCPLNYVSLEDATTKVETGAVEYCPENTNTSTMLNGSESKEGIYPNGLTSVLLKATVYEKETAEDGTESLVACDLVRFNGVLYKKEHFLATVLAQADPQLYKNDGVVVGTDSTKYTQIDESYFELKDAGDGHITVAIKEGATATYKFAANGAGMDSTAIAAQVEEVTGFISETSGREAIAYTGGAMYYNIPIEHLNNANLIASGNKVYAEAEYGVVRNHYYKITINKLEQLGMGVFDPSKKIVPGKDPEKYYVGARINVLSWKIVNQGAEL